MNKKRVVAAVLLVALVIGLAAFWFYQRANRKLSDLNDQELLQYLTDAGVVIPDEATMELIRGSIILLEDDPDYANPVSTAPILRLFEDLRRVVEEYERNRK